MIRIDQLKAEYREAQDALDLDTDRVIGVLVGNVRTCGEPSTVEMLDALIARERDPEAKAAHDALVEKKARLREEIERLS